MSVISEREEIKKAVTWVSEQLEEDPAQPIHKLVEKATFEFDLSPSDGEFLIRFFHERKAGK